MNESKIIAELTTTFGGYAKNDPAHKLAHFEEVLQNAKAISKWCEDDTPTWLYVLFSYIHDGFAYSRDNHHELSAQWVRTTDHPLIKKLTPVQIEELALACNHHRASLNVRDDYDAFPLFVQICAAADRGRPGDPMFRVKRAMLFRCADLNIITREQVQDALDHIKWKFGAGNEGMYPRVFSEHYKEALYQSFNTLENMTVEDVIEYHKLDL